LYSEDFYRDGSRLSTRDAGVESRQAVDGVRTEW
jgi:hypothetical protein